MLSGVLVATLFGLSIQESPAHQAKLTPSPTTKTIATTNRELTVSQPHILTLDDVSFDKSRGRINVYHGNYQHIIIPDNFDGIPVTEIWDYAFSEAEELSEEFEELPESPIASIVIPNTVTKIGESAFRRNALTQIDIPTSVTRIGYYAFAENALTHVDIPDSVTEIVEGAFAKNALTHVTLPNSLTEINERVFQDNSLTHLVLPNSVTMIGDRAFSNNAINKISIPMSVTEVGEEAFASNAISYVLLPTSITYMGDDAFINNPLRGRPIKGFGKKKPPRELTDEEFLEAIGDL